MDPKSSANISRNTTDFNSVFTKQVLPILYCVVFIGGLVLNSLAACIFFKIPNNCSFVVYLKNIVVADLLMTLTFPFKIANDFGWGGWYMRVVVCRYTAVLFYSSMYVGIVFLGLLSLERYFKVVQTSRAAVMQSVGLSKGLSFLTWLLLLLSVLPNSILSSKEATKETSKSCIGLKTSLGVRWHKFSNYCCVVVFWCIFLLMAFCYASIAKKIYDSYRNFRRDSTETKRTSNRNIFSILLVFFICFVPYHICRIPYTLSQTSSAYSVQSKFSLFHLKESTLLLSALNVCLDPIIYFLMCRLFREALLKSFTTKDVEVRRKSISAVYTASLV
ncbi:P2Y purinoceptor 14 [Amia ocellicauda]|uniref:P2Y purinoceptor 14 n=1 Tax=Amia ocellicauda TaxID=2972642 RepID=UPI0034647234